MSLDFLKQVVKVLLFPFPCSVCSTDLLLVSLTGEGRREKRRCVNGPFKNTALEGFLSL